MIQLKDKLNWLTISSIGKVTLSFLLGLETWHTALLSILTSALVSLFFNSVGCGSWECWVSFVACSFLLIYLLRYCRHYNKCIRIKKSNNERNGIEEDSLEETIDFFWCPPDQDSDIFYHKKRIYLLTVFAVFYASLVMFGYFVYRSGKVEREATDEKMSVIQTQLSRQNRAAIRDSVSIEEIARRLENLERQQQEELDLLSTISSLLKK